VRDYLVLQGVPAAQLTIISWGKERPAVGGTSEMALALNRRVSTVLMR
jgi:peptidoglycan-associated lipoprotein